MSEHEERLEAALGQIRYGCEMYLALPCLAPAERLFIQEVLATARAGLNPAGGSAGVPSHISRQTA